MRGVAPGFFNLTLRAHADIALLYLCRLFLDSSGQYNIGSLIQEAMQLRGTQTQQQELEVAMDKWLELRRDQADVLQHLEFYRNKSLAHTDRMIIVRRKDPRGRVTLGEAKGLFERADKLVNRVTYALFREKWLTGRPHGKDDFKQLLKAVQQRSTG